jgi:hypothetical protein
MPYHDDNFGHWDNMDPDNPDYEDNVRFYKKVQKRSVKKKCEGCERIVRLLPEYGYCNSCTTKIEQGWDI